MKALSLRQPWADAVLYGDKRLENRTWSNSNFRGRFLIHAAKGCTRREYDDAVRFMEERSIPWRPKPLGELVRGAIVGRANVTGIIHTSIDGVYRMKFPDRTHSIAHLAADDLRWWMGAFALFLDHVVQFPRPIPWSGSLGFFEVPFDADGRRVDP